MSRVIWQAEVKGTGFKSAIGWGSSRVAAIEDAERQLLELNEFFVEITGVTELVEPEWEEIGNGTS